MSASTTWRCGLSFQRRGLGRALLRAACSAARTAGAQVVTLNATPQGEPIYAGEGFARLGTGITYWHPPTLTRHARPAVPVWTTERAPASRRRLAPVPAGSAALTLDMVGFPIE